MTEIAVSFALIGFGMLCLSVAILVMVETYTEYIKEN